MKPSALLSSALLGDPRPGLLDDAARHAVIRRVSVPVTGVQAPTPAPDQESHQAPARFCSVLNRMLSEPAAERDHLLGEALGWLAGTGAVLPVRLLVPLLEAAESAPLLAAALPAVLGRRGRWLRSLNPAWLAGRPAETPQPESWDEGTTAERVAWLRHLRAHDPAAGRELVLTTRKEKAQDRAQFVAALEAGLSLDDEDLLEATLGDRSKEVAGVAARLLSLLPGSAYLGRLEDHARATFSRGWLRLTVTAPPKDASLAGRYAQVLTQEDFSAGDTPVGRVQQLLALLPPGRWVELCGIEAAQLAHGKVTLDGERIQTVPALAHAATRWKDSGLARVLVAAHAEPGLLLALPEQERSAAAAQLVPRLGAGQLGPLVAALPPGQLEPGVARALKAALGSKATRDHPLATELLYQELSRRAHPVQAIDWADDFSRDAQQESFAHRRTAALAAKRITLRMSAYQTAHDKEHA
ncbi:MAG: DUF5691 domain-containing protein [Propionibacteriaceae bacterium]|nr:DUF5691 domain-containing protein [Propionibacteriaceae bacterium]